MKAVYGQFFTNWKTAMQPVFNYSAGTGIPIYPVRGNYESNDAGQAPIEVLKQAYQKAFSAYVPANGPNNGLTNAQRGFSWSLTTNNVSFVAADQYFNFDPGYIRGCCESLCNHHRNSQIRLKLRGMSLLLAS
jgi:hypothetical protein